MDRWEERRGDVVTGGYAMLEPNGFIRNVQYQVADGQGFRVAVQTRPPPQSPQFLI